MANVVVDWEGQKPSITYGPEDNKVKVSIVSLSGWVREEIILFRMMRRMRRVMENLMIYWWG